MLMNKILEDHFETKLNCLKKEFRAILSYLNKFNIKINDLDRKLELLNFYIADEEEFLFTATNGNMYFMLLDDSCAACAPIITDDLDEIAIICLKKSFQKKYIIIHELFHFITMNYEKGYIKVGVEKYNESTNKDIGIECINEGITEYFSLRIYEKLDKKLYNEYINSKDIFNIYYYSRLLIELLCYKDRLLEEKLLKAVINNNSDYIFSMLCESFGITLNELFNLFERANIYSIDKEDKVGYEIFLEDIHNVIKYYYYNVYKKKRSDVKFIERIYKLFL